MSTLFGKGGIPSPPARQENVPASREETAPPLNLGDLRTLMAAQDDAVEIYVAVAQSRMTPVVKANLRLEKEAGHRIIYLELEGWNLFSKLAGQ